MLVKAKFNGKSSIGFTNGTTYTLDIDNSIFNIAFALPISNIPLHIKTKSGKYPDYKTLRCDYQRLSTFLSLWEIIFIWEETIDIKYRYLPSYNGILGMMYQQMRSSKINTLLNETIL